jgi:hypothetical protein
MIDIDALEALAKAATPGPWTVDEECLTDRGCLYVAKGKPGDLRGRVLEVFKNCLVRDAQRASNADFIAAANPDAILVLIAEVRALREDAERYRWSIAYEDNTETLLAAVMNNAPDKKAISAEIDAERSKEKS